MTRCVWPIVWSLLRKGNEGGDALTILHYCFLCAREVLHQGFHLRAHSQAADLCCPFLRKLPSAAFSHRVVMLHLTRFVHSILSCCLFCCVYPVCVCVCVIYSIQGTIWTPEVHSSLADELLQELEGDDDQDEVNFSISMTSATASRISAYVCMLSSCWPVRIRWKGSAHSIVSKVGK